MFHPGIRGNLWLMYVAVNLGLGKHQLLLDVNQTTRFAKVSAYLYLCIFPFHATGVIRKAVQKAQASMAQERAHSQVNAD